MPIKNIQNDFQEQAEKIVKKAHNKKVYLAVAIIFIAIILGLLVGIFAIIKNYDSVGYIKPLNNQIAKPIKESCVEEGEKFYLKPGESQEKECCPNLKTGAVYSIFDGKCIPEIVASVCIDCPNNECGIGENKCNCPEDCDNKDEIANWKTYRNEEYGFEMKYPEDFFPTEQILQPKTKLAQCDYANFADDCSTEIKMVNNTPFCLQEKSSVALGTAYTTYNYTTVKNKECFIVSFTVAYPACSNILPIKNQETQKAYDECKLGNEVTKPKIIDQIFSTFRFIEKEKQLYLGLNLNDEYSLVNLDSEKIIKFIPNGYNLVGYQFAVYPDYVILNKNDKIYSYSLKDKKVDKIDLPKLKEDEEIIQKQSISEKEKFYITKNTLDLEEEWGMGGPNVIKSERYLFNAEKNLIEKMENIDIDISSCNCNRYDSKYQRIFFWPCCEGIGSSIPLSVYDMKNKKKKELISLGDFDLTEDGIGLISLQYNSGNFLVISKTPEHFTKIITVDTKESPEKNIYEISKDIKPKIENTYAYSALLISNKKTIVVGGGHFILFLHFDENKIIKDSTYFSEPEVYANFIFTDEENLYYKVKDSIKIINFNNRKIEKSINDQKGGSITIFSY